MLIVLILLVAMLAIVWPQINRRIQRSELKQIALTLKEEISDARSAAIETGETWKLRFRESSNEYELGPLSSIRVQAADQPSIQIGIEQRDDLGENPSPQATKTELNPFVLLSTIEKEKLVAEFESSGQSSLETIPIGMNANPSENNDRSVTEISFFPDGRATELEFIIIDRRAKTGIEVKVRGLTGQVEIGKFLKIDAEFTGNEETDENGQENDSDSLDLALEGVNS